MSENSRIVGVTSPKDNDESISHIFFSRSDKTFCGYDVGFEDTYILSDYIVVGEHNNNMCQECIHEYNKWLENDGKREPTIKCKCDAMTTEGPERCEKVVSAYKARELRHPSRSKNLPVCPACYRWIKSLGDNSVEVGYNDAQPWLSSTKPESIDNME